MVRLRCCPTARRLASGQPPGSGPWSAVHRRVDQRRAVGTRIAARVPSTGSLEGKLSGPKIARLRRRDNEACHERGTDPSRACVASMTNAAINPGENVAALVDRDLAAPTRRPFMPHDRKEYPRHDRPLAGANRPASGRVTRKRGFQRARDQSLLPQAAPVLRPRDARPRSGSQPRGRCE
jgi:hypothetical protein